MKILRLCAVFAFAWLSSATIVSADIGEAVAMNGHFRVEYRDFPSEHVDETFRIFIARPSMEAPGQSYPVIYALDGNGSFGTVTEAVRLMSLGGEVPAAFVVGIGYAVDNGFAGAMSRRFRDYTPTAGGEVERITQASSDPTMSISPGGGPEFLKFLRDELKPAIEANYPVDPNDATFGGVSLGGLFPTWVLLTEPELFQRYVIISPSIWWNREEVWQWEAAYARHHDDLPATVFITAGSLETADALKESIKGFMTPGHPMKEAIEQSIEVYDRLGWPKMAEITPELTARLRSRNYPNLTIVTHNMPDETHMSVSPGAWSRGLRYVFGHWRP